MDISPIDNPKIDVWKMKNVKHGLVWRGGGGRGVQHVAKFRIAYCKRRQF